MSWAPGVGVWVCGCVCVCWGADYAEDGCQLSTPSVPGALGPERWETRCPDVW